MTYCTVQNVRDEGLTDVAAYPDATVQTSILLWQQLIDRVTRQWFEARPLTLELDGNDSGVLHFPAPIIEITSLKLNSSPSDLDPDSYEVYDSRTFPDDRRNPRIKLVRGDTLRDIYTAPLHNGELRFRKGRRNQEIVGTFGFLEEDDSTPGLITRALCKLVIEKLTNPTLADPANPVTPPPPVLGSLLEEWTDGHRVKFAQAGGATKPVAPGLEGMIKDPEVRQILKLYKGPIAMASPAHWSFR